MDKKHFKELLITSFILYMAIILYPLPLIAIEGRMTQAGYNYNQGVIVNWDTIDLNKKLTKEVVKTNSNSALDVSITKTIVIDSTTVKKKTNQDYVIVQHAEKPSNLSPSYTVSTKDVVEVEKLKPTMIAQTVIIDKLIEMRIQKQYPPTKNIVVEESRFPYVDKTKKNKKIQLTAKEMISVDLDKYKKLAEKNKEEQSSRVITKINDQYAVVGNNPFDDVFDSPSNTESLLKSKVKKTKAPSYNPLIQFPLSEYTVKGVITSDQGNRALIITSQGNYFYIKEGEFIGANKGLVDEIKNNSIVILERDRKVEIIISSDGRVSNR